MTAARRAASATPAPTLPELREDLRLIEGSVDFSGGRQWLIHDPLQNRFVSIGPTAYALLQLWRPGITADRVVEAAWVQFSETIDQSEVARFAEFLLANGFTLEAKGGGWRGYLATAERRRNALGSRLLHGYLFFRVPLLRPERFLRATLGFVRPLGTRSFGALVVLVGLVGLMLVSREWDAFRTTFGDVFSFQGIALLAVAMAAVKLLHELGHAYTAVHFGCRVPVIGVAFILGMPMLYCDVTDVWRLQSRRHRLCVDAAGVLVDLAVACCATFLWAFLPPGVARDIAFSLATAAWIFSLVMNLNPFMKFDGYHMLADGLGIANLQERAMELARWQLREMLFGLRRSAPEPMPRRARALMGLFGWAIWIYRLILFTGIAVAVYAFFFKLAGVVLFLVEIVYFIAAPLWRELQGWWVMRRDILKSWRSAVTASLALAVLAGLIIPWSSRVTIPAALEAGALAQVYPPVAARISEIHVTTGRIVEPGALLVTLFAPSLVQDLHLTELKAEVVRLRQSRRASDSQDRGEAVVLDQELAALMERRAGLRQQVRELQVRAPIAGEVAEMAPLLHPGRWFSHKEPLVLVRGAGVPVIRGYIDAADVWRVDERARARFIPDDVALAPIEATLHAIAPSASGVLDQIELIANFGGRIATHLDARRQPVPVNVQYAVRAEVAVDFDATQLRRTVPGVLIVEGHAESLLARFWRQALKVIVRESGA